MRISFHSLLVAVLVVICFPGTSLRAQDSATAPTVTVSQAESVEFIERIPVSGTIVAKEEVLIAPQVSGFPLTELLHDVGDYVRSGDVMAMIDDQTLAARLQQADAEFQRARAAVSQAENQISSAEANANQAQTVLVRTQRLFDVGTATQAQLDQAITAELTARAALASARDGLLVAQAQLEQAKASREIAALDLAHATITSPVDGLVSARNAQVGAIVSTGGQPLFRIIRDGKLEIAVEVVETALGKIEIGDLAQMTVAGGDEIEGRVERVDPVVNEKNRLGTVRISIPSDDLRPGLFADGWIITERRDGLAVPTTAVLSDTKADYVLRLNGDTLERVSVTAGMVMGDKREILEGLVEGDTVVRKSGAFFNDGDRVKALAEDVE